MKNDYKKAFAIMLIAYAIGVIAILTIVKLAS